MKLSKLFASVAILALMLSIVPVQFAGAATSELFFSEYIEGSSFNKAVEIYNGTGSTVDLSTYTVELYSNGAASPSQSVILSGTLADGDVYVLAHGSADAAILAAADLVTSSVINFNGDDALVLKNNGSIVDAFGQVGVDPGSEWTGGGLDDTLRRSEDICAGDTDPSNAFDASMEWVSFATNTFDGLGAHTANCSTTAVEAKINEIQVSTSGTDWEFFELQGSPGTDLSALTLVGIESDAGSSAGVIDLVISLAGQSVPADGFWLGINSTGAGTYGVSGDMSIAENSFENSTATYFLVSGFTGALNDDLDTDNDGTFDSTPWEAILDSVNIRDIETDFNYGAPVVGPDGTFLPSGTFRCPDAPIGSFDNNILNFSVPDGTPGVTNACAAPTPDILINEADSDTPGTDALEFVELFDGGDGNTALNGLVVVFFNGSNDLSYAAFDLDGFSTDANGYFLLGNSGVVPTPGITFAGNLLQNGADAVALYQGDAAEFPTGTAVTTENLIDALVYGTNDADDAGLLPLLNAGQPQVDESGGGDSAIHSNQRCPNGSGGARNTDTFAQFTPTPGAENTCGAGGPVEAKIHEVQGSGDSVAITGAVTVEAIVIADYQADDDQLSGFFLQEEDTDVDADASTSEGIFVYCGACATDVAVGDTVEVTGQAVEFFGMSQVDVTGGGTVTVISSGNPLPTPATIDLPASGSTRAASTFENLEGMLVTFTDELVVSEYFELARYGQLVLTADARPSQFTDANEPSVPGYAAFLDELNSKRIILDDDNNIQNDAIEVGPDEPYYWPRPGLSITNFVRGGDSITGLTGVLHWSFAGQSGTDAWRVRPVEEAFTYDFTSNNERTAAPEDVGGSLKVASFNVLNYFTTLDSRGADSVAELDRQRAKTASAICIMDADIVGLIEIENNGGVAIDDLLNGAGGINANCGPYAYIDTGVLGSDEIIQAFIYNPATVSPVGDFAVLDSTVDPRFLDDYNRPALAQTFQDNTTGGIFTVVVNHLKSKGSSCNAVSDPDILDGQGNCNITRMQAAAAMVDWLATDPTGSGDDDFLIMGDLNSYRNEDPIDTIEAGADDTAGTADDYTDLLDSLIGPSAYSYVFDGQLGYLDTGLVSSGLLNEVTGVTVWHINADEIPVFDYNDAIDDGSAESSFERESAALPIYEPNAYRSSDHDPVIIGLDVCDEIAPAFDELSVSPSTLWPANHKYVDVTATVVVSDNFDPAPVVTLVSVTSNEPDDGLGDGDTANDIVIVDDFNFQLRAERAGTGQGRIYTITYMVTDACGNSTTQSVTVSVPKSQARVK